MKSFSQLAFFFFLSIYCCAQNKLKETLLKNNQYQLGAAAFLSTNERLPFWLHANQYGEVPLESQFLQLSGAVKHDYDSLYNSAGKLNKFSWGYGAKAIVNTGKVNQFIISEGYLKARYTSFEIYAGRRKEIFGLVDTTLTSGSYTWSGNALPIPKIQISTPNYIPILKNKLISIKGGFAHGWFDEDRLHTSKIKLHQKWLYFRLGKPSWKINIFGGGNHQAQWGGYSPFYTVDGRLPDGFQNYIHVVLGTRGAIRGLPGTGDFDANRIGNHLGSIDLALSLKLSNSKFLIYRQSLYEDGSLFYLNNIKDGLNGVSWTNEKPDAIFQKIGIEYFNTADQGGDVFKFISPEGEAIPPELRGLDAYFVNGQFKDGWTNKNMTIGTPFIEIPSKQDTTLNYSLQVIHIAIKGNFNERLSYSLRSAFTKNFGQWNKRTNLFELQNYQTLGINYKWNNKIDLGIDSAFDFGTFKGNSGGIKVKFIYTTL